MRATLIFGHKKPDTDSVCSAIALADLKTQLKENAIPRVIGDINFETKFVLNYFNIPEPKYLNDVRLQIRDLNYRKGVFCHEDLSLYNVVKTLKEHRLSSIPLVNEHKKYLGIISMQNITNKLICYDDDTINTSYENIIDTLNGEMIYKCDENIMGHLIVASYRSTTFIKNVNLTPDSILIVGDRHSIIEYAVQSKVKLIIVTGNNIIKDEHIAIAIANNVNIIRTPLRTFNVVKIISMCNFAKTLIEKDNIITFNELDYVKAFTDEYSKSRHKIYPIVNRHGDCMGLIEPSDITNKVRKKVFLVDHNEKEQSVDGLDDAEIVGVIDHHKLGTIGTSQPINFRNMTVGCTCTIIYHMYKENNLEIPKNIAGIMLSAIISDTLLFRSPTTSEEDINTANELAKIANIDIQDYAMKMFKAGSSLKGKTMQDIIFSDFKLFNEDDYKVGVGQFTTLSIDELKEKEEDLIATIEKETEIDDYDVLALFVTDIINNGSYLYYCDKGKIILEKAFHIDNLHQGYYLSNIVSRKQQIIPSILNVIE